jgi:16S rRNA (guanine1207-N2)-methyltransferase
MARPAGVIYAGRRAGPLPKLKDFSCRLAFRDGERLIRAVSRPGVFSHREIDEGARALLAMLRVAPGARVLDLGCGSGVVGLAAALRAPGVSVLAVDSNARAVDCAARGAALNALETFEVLLDEDGSGVPARAFDVVAANPPYYSNFRIASHFVQVAHRSLKPHGTALFVTKSADWFLMKMGQLFDKVALHRVKGYAVVEGRKRGH